MFNPRQTLCNELPNKNIRPTGANNWKFVTPTDSKLDGAFSLMENEARINNFWRLNGEKTQLHSTIWFTALTFI